MEKLFIGIPTLNRPLLVRETIQSVLHQSYKNYKVIVSDNCSDGDATESVEHYINDLADCRLEFFRQPENRGEYGQGRFFFEQAHNYEYFMMLHDDDVLEPEYIETAMGILQAHPNLALFVANPLLMDVSGKQSDYDTLKYLADHGREARKKGEFDVLSSHLNYGFTPISGTLFRTAALKDSGFVDEDCTGNYPFELNVLLRLGENHSKAWFEPRQLLGFRFHTESMRNYIKLMENPVVVDTMIKLFERRRFSGANERRRKTILSRLLRAKALISLQKGSVVGARANIARALRVNPLSVKGWLVAPLIIVMPWLLKWLMLRRPEFRQGPRLIKG